MDYRICAVPGIVCGGDGPHDLRPALDVWSSVALYGRLLWIHCHDLLLRSWCESLSFQLLSLCPVHAP